MNPRPFIIAIDGPAGAGKSTVARGLAERLGLAYVDSGATYRAAALKVLETGVSPGDPEGVIQVMSHTHIQFLAKHADSRVLLDGRDVTRLIRTPEVTLAATQVSRLPEVRTIMLALQRSLAEGPGVVMEGRDIVTVVFPDAPVKIFLEAESGEWAQRRLRQEEADGRSGNLKQ